MHYALIQRILAYYSNLRNIISIFISEHKCTLLRNLNFENNEDIYGRELNEALPMVKYARGLYVFLLVIRVSPLDDGSLRNNSGGRHSTNRVSNANESGVVALQGGHYQIR
jgi:hypothetical protein